MVIKFTSNVVQPPVLLYMGVDKFENEHLIKYGWPEDVWFHVDKLSSAHVYLRLPEGMTIDSIPELLVEDCVQLVKANSIEGNKLNNVDVVYTMWSNLHKTGDMAIGQIGFHSQRAVRKIRVEKRKNEIINRLNKTEKKEDIDYKAERDDRDAKERQHQRAAEKIKKEAETKLAEQKEKERRIRNYEDVEVDDALCNKNNEDGNLSDDFM
ncbi:unnamed protein product, partial [Mesorhabditis belari]|uniref:Coiled-coil domain-containing protein 25 n=1 Tax=Mesorhabditis belari TaxID=2138241 RepID=A0AAF3FG94_9BILA